MIVQVGHYPPPIGGVSIYIKRMKDNLDIRGWPNQVWDISRVPKKGQGIKYMPMRFLSVPFKHFADPCIDVIHYNVRGNLIKNYIGVFNRLLFRKRKKVITIHGNAKNMFKSVKSLIIPTLNSFDAIICVKKNDKKILEQNQIRTNIYEIPAFIPPIEKKQDSEQIAIPVWKILSSHYPIIYANASAASMINGVDLYGIDLCIETCAALKKQHKQIALMFFLPDARNQEYMNFLESEVAAKGLKENFFFIRDASQIYPLIKYMHLFLRPTISDGDAISLREALYYRIPSIASDAVERPRGTVLFRNRDVTDLIAKTNSILTDYNRYKDQLSHVHIDNNFDRIMDVYANLRQ